MEHVEKTGLFTCLREKTWKELTVAEVDRMACEFVETVRRALENHAGYLEASRFLEELGKRLNYWVGCQDKASMEEEQGRIFLFWILFCSFKISYTLFPSAIIKPKPKLLQ